MGIADKTGSLEPGKMADVVLWSKNPFSVYAIAEEVFIDGALVLDTSDPATSYRSDFENGNALGRNEMNRRHPVFTGITLSLAASASPAAEHTFAHSTAAPSPPSP